MRCLIVSLPVLVLACGGSIGPIDPASLHIEGSYDFMASSFTVDPTNSCCIQPDNGHPILSQHARLDIKKSGTDYDAVLTPEFGDPQSMVVTLDTDGSITLAGSAASFSGGGPYSSTTDTIDTIKLAVGSDGHLTGVFTATGAENVFEGDVGWNGNATATGTVLADARAPQAQASSVSSAASVVLPWDTLYARMSEPIDSKSLSSAISLSPANGTASVNWQIGTSVDWVGAVSVTGYRKSWDDFTGVAAFGVAGGLVDPSGNASSATSTQLQFLSVPKASAFSGATPPAMWGKSQIATGADACGTDPSCIELGPLQGPCTADPGGIAGRFDAAGGKTLAIKFRLRAQSQSGQPYLMSGPGFDVAAPGASAQMAYDASLTIQFNPTSDTTYPYATDWLTANITLPASSGEVGFSMLPFGASSSYCGGGPALPPITLTIDVASISVL